MSRKRNTKIGAGVLMLLFTLLFFILAGKFFYVAYSKEVAGVDLIKLAKQKWMKSDVLDASRGTIFDKNGVVLATDIPAYTVIAILDKTFPNHITDPKQAAQKLAGILQIDEIQLEQQLSKTGKFQVELASGRKITNSQKEQIESLKIPGIDFIRLSARYYPQQTFASHVLGYTNVDEQGNKTGAMGLEQSLNSFLTEKNGKITFLGDKLDRELPQSKDTIIPPKPGDDVYLTLDQKIQLYLEQAMTQAQNQYKAKRMVGIVADPKTGRILAMSSYPSFNPNKRDITNYTNYAITPFEPGSTMKIYTVAAAMQEGVYNGNENYKSGSYKVPGNPRPVYDWNRNGWGNITFDEGIRKSSNVAASILVREKLGYDKFRSYLTKFGLDRPTGIDLPMEQAGKILYHYEIEKVTTSFGQGTTVSPIQQIQAASAIANGGKMMKPYIIDKIINPKTKKVVLQHEPEVAGTPISAETAKKVRDLLGTVVTEGTGTPYQIPGYSVAGKTGTAQVADEKTGRYLTGYSNYIFSFMGMVPKDNPKLLMYIAVDRPTIKLPVPGSAPVASIFTSVMKNSLAYLNIQPEEPNNENQRTVSDNTSISLPDVTGNNADDAQSQLQNKGFQVVRLGTGSSVIGQEPFAGAQVLKGERVLLLTGGEMKMPDLTGWSYMDILRFAKLANLKESINGDGFVTKQNLPPNTPVKQGDYMVIDLSPPGTETSTAVPNKKTAKEGKTVSD